MISHFKNRFHNCNVLRDLVPFVQFKKREKHPWYQIAQNITEIKISHYSESELYVIPLLVLLKLNTILAVFF